MRDISGLVVVSFTRFIMLCFRCGLFVSLEFGIIPKLGLSRNARVVRGERRTHLDHAGQRQLMLQIGGRATSDLPATDAVEARE